jgi:hypothetical protein
MPIRRSQVPSYLQYDTPDSEPQSNATAFQAAANSVLHDWAPSEDEEGSSFTPGGATETYPEQRADGSVWEVTYNRMTGAYTDRMVNPGGGGGSTSWGTAVPGGGGSTDWGQPNPLQQAGRGISQMPEALGTAASAWAEPFGTARGQDTYDPISKIYGQRDAGPISRMLQEAQQFPPIVATAANAAEMVGGALFGSTIKGVVVPSLLRASQAFAGAASRIPVPAQLPGLLTDEAARFRLPLQRPERWYHITPAEFPAEQIKPMAGNPIFVSKSASAAEEFVKVNQATAINAGKPLRTLEYELDSTARVLDLTKLSDVELTQWMLKVTDDGRIPMQDALQATGYDVVHATGRRSMVSNPAMLHPVPVKMEQQAANLLSDELGFVRLGGLDLQSTQRAVREAMADNMAGLRDFAKAGGQEALDRFSYTVNRLGSTVTIASERTRQVYIGVARKAADAGIQPTEFDGYVDDVERFLTAKTAASWKAAHPSAHDRQFGMFTGAKEAAVWDATFKANPDPTYVTAVEDAARVVADNYKHNRDMLLRTGRLSKAEHGELTQKYPWYNPLEYTDIARPVADDPRHPIGATMGMKTLAKDVPAHASAQKPMDAVMLANNSAERFYGENELMREALDVARRDPQMAQQMRKLRPSETIQPNTERSVQVWNRGQLEQWAVPKWLADELRGELGIDNGSFVERTINSINMLWRKGAIDFNPSFIVNNVFNDMINSYATSGNVPVRAAGEFVRYLKNNPDDQVMQLFRLAGAEQSKFWQTASRADKVKYATELMSESQKAAGLTTPEAVAKHLALAVPRMLKGTATGVQKVGRATEQGNRLAVFQKTLDDLLPDWKQMDMDDLLQRPEVRRAVNTSLESIINYGRGGWLMKNLNRVIPFANVAMQGALLPFKAAQTPQGRRRIAGLLATYTGITYYNNSYPENADVPPHIRYGSAYIMLPTTEYTIEGRPKPNYIVLGPLRDWIVATGPISYVVEKFRADSPTAGHGLTDTVLQNLPTGIGPGPALTDTLLVAFANYDAFRGRPVVPTSEQGLSDPLQFGTTTSPTAIGLGQLLGKSPRVIQRVIESAATAPGRTALSVTDWTAETFFADKMRDEVDEVVDAVNALPPDQREYALTAMGTDMRKFVEQRATLVRKPSIPVVGPIVRSKMPGVGGALEEVMPRSEIARQQEMEAALGREATLTLRDLGAAVPVMNDYVSHEGRRAKLDDAQLEKAHEFFKTSIQTDFLPDLENPYFARWKREDPVGAKKWVADWLEQEETAIKMFLLTPAQRDLLGLPAQ